MRKLLVAADNAVGHRCRYVGRVLVRAPSAGLEPEAEFGGINRALILLVCSDD